MARPVSKTNQLPTLLPITRKENMMKQERYYLCLN
jgi:hypothetical protein